jgi:hypothetical protein
VDEARKLALMLAGVEPEEESLVGLSRRGFPGLRGLASYLPEVEPAYVSDSGAPDPTTADILAKQEAMYSGPGGALRSLKDKIPEVHANEESPILSRLGRTATALPRAALESAASWWGSMSNALQGKGSELSPGDILVPPGSLIGLGGVLPKAGASGVSLGDHAMAKWIAHRDRHKPGLESIQGEADVRMGRDPSSETFEDHYGKARVGEKHPLNIKPAYQPTDYDFRQTFDAEPPPPPGTTKAISATESAWGPDVPDWFKWSMAHDNARADRKAIDQYRTGLNAASLRELTEDINFFHKQMEGLPFNSPEFKAYRMRLDAAREALDGLKTKYEVLPGDLLADNSKSSLPGLVAGSLDRAGDAPSAAGARPPFQFDDMDFGRRLMFPKDADVPSGAPVVSRSDFQPQYMQPHNLRMGDEAHKAVMVNGQPVAVARLNRGNNGEITIQRIDTVPGARRQGYAKQLVDDIFAEFPGAKVRTTMQTDSGRELFKNYERSADGYISPKSPDSPSAAGARNAVLIDDIAENAAHPSGPIQAYHGSRAVGSAGDLDPSFSGHLGVHFGTKEQATKRLSQEHLGFSEQGGQVFPTTIDLKKPITLPDLGSWSGEKLIKAVVAADPRAKGLEMPPRPAPGSSVKAYDDWADKAQPIVRDWLSRNGYDGIRYRNTEEGKGWSYIVLDKKSIRESGDAPSAAGALEKQIAEYRSEGTLRPEHEVSSSAMPMSAFNGKDIRASQTSVDAKGLKHWTKQIEAGERPSVLLEETEPGKYRIVDGHTRATAYRQLGIDEVPVLIRRSPDSPSAAGALPDNPGLIERLKAMLEKMPK